MKSVARNLIVSANFRLKVAHGLIIVQYCYFTKRKTRRREYRVVWTVKQSKCFNWKDIALLEPTEITENESFKRSAWLCLANARYLKPSKLNHLTSWHPFKRKSIDRELNASTNLSLIIDSWQRMRFWSIGCLAPQRPGEKCVQPSWDWRISSIRSYYSRWQRASETHFETTKQ